MAVQRVAAVLAVIAFCAVQAKIPDYIHVCKRNDPNINGCIINAVEKLRPYLKAGIPELDVPSLEPLIIPEIVISRGGGFRAVGSNVTVTGASNFKILDVKANVDKGEYMASVFFPILTFDAIYDVNAKILSLVIKGKGPLTANTTDVEGTAILKGKKVKMNGMTVMMFNSMETKLKMKNYSIKLEGLFGNDPSLGEAVNVALNENKRELMQLLRPRAEQTVSEVILNIANKITTHFDYDELFPM